MPEQGLRFFLIHKKVGFNVSMLINREVLGL